METQVLNQQTNTSISNPNSYIKLYSPKQYGFMGFFLSLIPVFIMSFSNSKFLQNGEFIKKRMKIYLIVFIVLFIAYFAILSWASVTITKSLAASLMDDPSAMARLFTAQDLGMDTNEIMDDIMPQEALNAKKILENMVNIFVVLNTILLIVVVRFTNKNELDPVKELKNQKKAESRNMVIPALSGIGFLVICYFGTIPLLEIITKAII